MVRKEKLKRWELALLVGCCMALVVGVWAAGQQGALANDVLRLHVLANSDSDADQALKLKVRDAVLEKAGEKLDGVADVAAAKEILSGSLTELAQAGERVVEREGYDYPVTASLERTWFPTKEYEDFSLPAGTYEALRVVIGSGEGHNWWCVVFPPLCLGAVTEQTGQTASFDGLSQQEVALMTGETEGYVVKFKVLELWGELQEKLQSGQR